MAAPKIVAAGSGTRVNVLGDHQTIRLTGADTDGALTVIEESFDPGVGVPLHYHEREEETFNVLEGEVAYELNGHRTVAGPGTTVFVPRGVPHRFEAVGTKRARVLLVITPAGLEGMFIELEKLPPGPPDPAKVAEICGRFGVRLG
ncbi:MAG: cupin domain-containing protein [Phycisphaerae bacterium]|jgi:quercetin dioxygenase-like cupin family protein|nr:cupin domain-containing protein [Phycisphaerae bacterium]